MIGFLKKYEERVLAEITSLENDIPRTKEETKPVEPDDAIGRLTRMEAIGARSIAQAQLRTLEGRLERLRNILKRIGENDSTLGTCLDCGEKIGSARLLARPESIRCVECLDDQS